MSPLRCGSSARSPATPVVADLRPVRSRPRLPRPLAAARTSPATGVVRTRPRCRYPGVFGHAPCWRCPATPRRACRPRRSPRPASARSPGIVRPAPSPDRRPATCCSMSTPGPMAPRSGTSCSRGLTAAAASWSAVAGDALCYRVSKRVEVPTGTLIPALYDSGGPPQLVIIALLRAPARSGQLDEEHALVRGARIGFRLVVLSSGRVRQSGRA